MPKEKIKFILLLIVVAVSAVVVWYSPTLFKGYSTLISRDALLLARNYSQDGAFGIEDDLNIVVASSLAPERANPSIGGNKLTVLGYAQLFKIFGLPDYENLIFYPIAILAIALLFFTAAVYYLYNLKTALLFALIYILMPFYWQKVPYNFGSYEFPLLFLSLFFLFFVLGWKSQHKLKYLYLILAGSFLALSGLSKEAMLLAVPVFFLYLLFQRQKAYLLAVFIPFIILFGWLWLPDMISGQNAYILLFVDKDKESSERFLDYGFYSHIFPDPYTYHFNQENFLKEYQASASSQEIDTFQGIEMKRAISFMGIEKADALTRLKIGTALLARRLSRFLAIESVGGPFIFILFILGFIYLRRENRYLYRLFVFWIIFVVLSISFIILGNRNHLMDFGLVFPLAVALGLLFLIDILSQHFELKPKGKIIMGVLLSLLVLYNLVLSGHVLWGRVYDSKSFLIAPIYAKAVNELNINDNEVIAVNIPGTQWAKLNYMTDKSMVVFTPETMEKLIEQGKIETAFNNFKIKYILGYSPELTDEIIKSAEVDNIMSNNVELTLPEVSKTKSWLMNLIR